MKHCEALEDKKANSSLALRVLTIILAVLLAASTLTAVYFYSQNQNDNSTINELSATVASMENTIQKLNSTDGLLYVVVATSGTFTSIAGESNTYNVTLNNVPRLIWFSDRPQRATGHMPTTQLVDTWTIGGNFSFAQDPPNAAIEVANSSGTDRTVIVKLSSPSYHNSTSAVSFIATILPITQNVSGRLSIFNPSKSSSLPQSFGLVTVYIDDGDGGCNLGPFASCQNADLEGAFLYEANLLSANFTGANLYNANLQEADLQDANLLNTNLTSANLEYAILQSAYLYNSNLDNSNLQFADLEYANLVFAWLVYANMQSANLEYANLQYADLGFANLQNANVQHAYFCYASMPNGSISNAC